LSQYAQCESNGIHNFHQWGFRAELWTLFVDKDLDLLCETLKNAITFSGTLLQWITNYCNCITEKTGKVSPI